MTESRFSSDQKEARTIAEGKIECKKKAVWETEVSILDICKGECL